MENLTANELRLGNLVFNKMREINQVCFKITNTSENSGMKINGISERFIQPIPLTEDWLLKFGFNKKINTRFCNAEMFQICNKYIIAKPWGKNLMMFNNTLSRGYLLDVKYVHQLQNLYFALTGKELLIALK